MNKVFYFTAELALRYGVTEAVLLQRFAERLDDPLDKDLEQGLSNVWLRLSYQQLQADIPFFSLFKIRKAVEMLSFYKLIIICDVELKETLTRRGTLCYGLTRKGYEITHEQDA